MADPALIREEAPFATRGENYVGRALESELRGGVPHYVTGQHHATIPVRGGYDYFDPASIGDVGRVTYVDVMGHAVVLLAWREKGTVEWKPTWVGRAGHYTTEDAVRAPDGLLLSEQMLAALAEADIRDAAAASDTRHALEGLLDWAERFQAGDPSLDPEEWYANRDYARIVLGRRG